ncbi:MAG: peptidylprolyl isomerase [Candidatus Latescibacteria bacterium]|nr:peptidylprolyl isomerase [Candidatus Latescibacterota bacterium]
MKKSVVYHRLFMFFVCTFLMLSFNDCSSDNSINKPVQYRLRQIMMEPEISPEHDAEVKKQAEAILKRASAGDDFTRLAKLFSQEPGASKTGGDLGYFTHNQMVKPFSDAVFSMKPGEIRGLVKTQYGYHIIKLHEIQGDKRHAQHILYMLAPGKEDSLATLKALGFARDKIMSGEKFEMVFSKYNTIETLKQTDGYMVWQKPDDMLESFAMVIQGLCVGDVSEPFISIIGFHIVKVDSINYDPDKLLTGFPAYIEKRLNNQ